MSSLSQPKISVIVPVYKAEKYLPFALRSLFYQTYQNLEIIVVNDGSPDNSLKIAKKWQRKDPRIVIFSQRNQGVSAARNLGLDHVTGDYVGLLDADDYLHPEFYERLIKKIQEDPQLEMVSYDVKIVKDHNMVQHVQDTKILGKGKFISPLDLYKKAIKDHSGHIAARIYATKLWKDIRFVKGIIYEDVEVVRRLYKNIHYGSFAFKDALYYYFNNRQGISKVRSIVAKYTRYVLFDKHEKIALEQFPELYEHCHNRKKRMAKSIYFWRHSLKGLTRSQEQTIIQFVEQHWQEYSWGDRCYLGVARYTPCLARLLAKFF